MRIEQSAIFMSSYHHIDEQHSRTENLDAWAGPRPGMNQTAKEDRFARSGEISDKLSASLTRSQENYGLDDTDQSLSPHLSLIKRLIELFTGKKINVGDLSQIKGNKADIGTANNCSCNKNSANAGTQPMEGWGVRYDLQESYSESEQTNVSIQGIVQTSEGSEISFNLNLQMNRSYLEQNSVSIRLGDAVRIDPVVVNFNGTAAQLTDWKFDFDLNADGVEENIPFVTSGSGILAFDKNGDNQVNDGSELFGPSTGNGFAELAALDEDNNKWIDENDPVYNKLYIWRRDQSGSESLVSLAESNIGALNVGCIDSSFDLKDQNNNLQGRILRTGVYLSNSGMTGAIQQLDVAV
jgi:hypothetical protein